MPALDQKHNYRFGNEYKEKHKEVRQRVKEDKKQYIEEQSRLKMQQNSVT